MAWQVRAFTDGGAAPAGVGAHGSRLARLAALGVPTLRGFTLFREPTSAAPIYDTQARRLVERALQALRAPDVAESPEDPALLVVWADDAASTPVMVPAVGLSVGQLDDLARRLGSRRRALDVFQHLLVDFSHAVGAADAWKLECAIARLLDRRLSMRPDPDEHELAAAGAAMCDAYRDRAGRPFPDDSLTQVHQIVEALADRAAGGVHVAEALFGSAEGVSGCGSLTLFDDWTGERGLRSRFIPNGDPEEVALRMDAGRSLAAMGASFAAIREDLDHTARTVETGLRDALRLEFVVERGRWCVVDARPAARSSLAAVAIPTSLAREGLITTAEALRRIDVDEVGELVVATAAEPGSGWTATGLGACPGAACGRVALDAGSAHALAREGPVVLVREETGPSDVPAMRVVDGVLTRRGGLTSHASVVARAIATPCVTGCADLRIDLDARQIVLGSVVVREGELVTIDGSSGRVFAGAAALRAPLVGAHLNELLACADDLRTLEVHANADTAEDVARAREKGADGVGLCRTEHMLLEPERLALLRKLLAHRDGPAANDLARLVALHTVDVENLIRAADGLPLIIRLLDAPLHEFLPDDRDAAEHNPMLGLRGVRLGLTYPWIYEAQVTAVARAVRNCGGRARHSPGDVLLLCPLIGFEDELKRLRGLIDRVWAAEAPGADVRVGAMIEVPRAAMICDRLARVADFLSFGTNDLTQMTSAISRDDAEASFLRSYLNMGLVSHDPFVSIDVDGAGELMAIGVVRARRARPGVRIGVCGEHAGDPRSIGFFASLGLDYVSCSPPRLQLARLAAGQVTSPST
jgi:pyruvate, orthophosphate dikinase